MLLTNEEGIDWVNRAGLQWPATEGDPMPRADRRRHRARSQEGQSIGRSGAWAATTTRIRSPSRATAIRSFCRATTLRDQPQPVADLLVHRVEQQRPILERHRRPLGVRLRQPCRRRLLRLQQHRRATIGQRPLHPGAQGDRHRAGPGWQRHDGRGRAVRSAVPDPSRRPMAAGNARRARRAAPASTARSGCSSTGAT